jgi:carbonic anhydrase/acetyltransferase-like protein (isoleucine patch superfamily)
MIEALGDVAPRIHPDAWVHPAATVIGDVEIGAQASVWPGAVLRGDFGPIVVGARTCVQDNVVIHADGSVTVVGSGCVIGHQAFIEGAVIEDGCLVGVGARVLPGARLGTGSVAAAGAVLVQGLQVPPGHRAQGVPAVVVAAGHPDPAYIARGAQRYVDMVARMYRPRRP